MERKSASKRESEVKEKNREREHGVREKKIENEK